MRAAGQATRDRILAVAKNEFARYGLAGARINRIAADAMASKDRLYAYFDSKEQLFAEVSSQWISRTAYDLALSGDDLPGYVGRLFDDFLEHPENARLQFWAELEVTDPLPADDPRVAMLRAKVAEIRRAQSLGLIDDFWHAPELVGMLVSIARDQAVPNRHPRLHDQTERSVADRRAAAVEAARRLVQPR
ncbi:TetR family transcriptional regulator [Tsukamurella pseudospumae]|uniref:TetR family transcriptional regulator n=1 Tax=Tsukamurella pseudospumae TaxID=239498 RepID=A0A138AN51_9ACTN|nr:TetR family transcriptional regulator [Tsukamurella pseudospumae]KXO97809.1 TetR family transcriptional regulator [Tsukamurella pseudospumae]KXP11842.1 TetR family transcriptional regulator [Tsukamurella pseudospumae]